MAELTAEELLKKMEEIIKDDPRMIQAFRPKIVPDELWEYAVAMMPELFPECKRKTYRVAGAAIRVDGFNLRHIDPVEYSGEQMRKLCWMAVDQNPRAIEVVPKEFRTNELLSYVYAKDPELLLQETKVSADMMTDIIDKCPGLIRSVRNPSDELIIKALERDPRCIVYFNTISDTVKDYFEEHYPQYAAMVLHD